MQRARLASIDALRGIAVLAVLLNHLPFSYSLSPADQSAASPFPLGLVAALKYGRFGVNLFLVISGFCIHMQACRPGVEVRFLAFWRRRLRRLYPPYAAAVAMSLAGLFVLFGLLGHRHGLVASFGYASAGQLLVDVVALLFLAQNLNGAYLRVGNPPFWSLALEEQLYMLYFPLRWLRSRVGWTVTLIVVVASTIGWRLAGELWHGRPDCWFVVGPSLWLDWTLGAVAVEAYAGLIVLPEWAQSSGVGFAFTAAGLVLNDPTMMSHHQVATLFADATFSLAFFVWLNIAVAHERELASGALSRVLAAFGTWSYSLYLTHEPTMVATKQLAMRIGLGAVAITALRIAAPLAVGYAFHRLIERRFMSALPPSTSIRSTRRAWLSLNSRS